MGGNTQLTKAKVCPCSEEQAIELRSMATATNMDDVSIALLIEQDPTSGKDEEHDPTAKM